MHLHSIEAWKHSHDYMTSAELSAERRTRWVVYLTLGTMLVELIAGWLTGSMALLADGWHMGRHIQERGSALEGGCSCEISEAFEFWRTAKHQPKNKS